MSIRKEKVVGRAPLVQVALASLAFLAGCGGRDEAPVGAARDVPTPDSSVEAKPEPAVEGSEAISVAPKPSAVALESATAEPERAAAVEPAKGESERPAEPEAAEAAPPKPVAAVVEAPEPTAQARSAGPSSAGQPSAGQPAPVPPPPALAEIYDGPTRRFSHPRGWYSFDLPKGWSAEVANEEVVSINPGLRQGDTIEALLFVTHGELEGAERSKPIEELVVDNRSEVRTLLRELGVRGAKPKGAPERVLAGDLPGAQQLWTGRTADGKPVEAWIAAVAKGEYFLATIGVILGDHTERYLPGLKRVFHSLSPTPPKPNPALARLLAGRSVAHSSVNSSGSASWIYDFRPDGTVRVESLMSFSGMGVSGGSTEESGRYDVVGDEVFIALASGQEVGTVVAEGGRLVGVRFGSKLYAAR